MRVLILGGDGMLGHELFLRLRSSHDARVTLRQPLTAYSSQGLFELSNAFCGIEMRTVGALERVLGEFRPQAVINAVGIVKQRPESEDAITSIEVNALLPHRLALACRPLGARVIHLSTDCVFTGD